MSEVSKDDRIRSQYTRGIIGMTILTKNDWDSFLGMF